MAARTIFTSVRIISHNRTDLYITRTDHLVVSCRRLPGTACGDTDTDATPEKESVGGLASQWSKIRWHSHISPLFGTLEQRPLELPTWLQSQKSALEQDHRILGQRRQVTVPAHFCRCSSVTVPA